jgi:septal ring factor EnvC (AmiA/AmiB activator)
LFRKNDFMHEIRLRDVDKEIVKQLEKIASQLHEKTLTSTLIRLVQKYQGDQDSIKQLQQRNDKLHREIARYYEKEDQMARIVQECITAATRTAAQAKSMLKRFGKKNQPGAR